MTKDRSDACACASRQGDAPMAPMPEVCLDDLFRLHADQVARWASRLCGPGVEVDDVVQEVFMIAHRKRKEFRGDSRPSTWLYGITQNVVRHRRRNERVRRFFLGEVERDTQPARPTPVEEFERREASRAVYRALDALPEKYREVFVLFEIEGLSGAEICELTGRNASTIRVHLMRAREQFFKRLGALGYDNLRGDPGVANREGVSS